MEPGKSSSSKEQSDMRARYVIAMALLAVGASVAQAQETSCPASTAGNPPNPLDPHTISQDACQKAVDLFAYMAPQLGTVIAGGNATLGQGGTLGGIGRFSLGVRLNALAASLPRLDEMQPTYGGRQASTIPVTTAVLPGPAVDAALGIFKGFPLGVTNVGGVDLLLSAMYLPEVSTNQLKVALPDGSLKVGYGARIGLLQESLVAPGVSATYLRRDLPTVNMTVSSGSDELRVTDLSVKTGSWRLVASKSLIMFGLALGVGQDTYESQATVQATASSVTSSEVTVSQKITRLNYFGDVSMNLPFFKIVGEVGMVSGGDVETFNNWEGKQPDDSRLYGSVGLRFAF
jgi:hypothetical protein